MNIIRLIPFLPVLLLLLPANSGAAPMVLSSPTNQTQTHTHLNPSDLCPLMQIVDHELCAGAMHAKNASKLCALLQEYNASFCSGEKDTKPISYDAMSVRVLVQEFHNANKNNKDIHKICPIINFIEQELCTSSFRVRVLRFDPKELCPLLNLTYTEFCE